MTADDDVRVRALLSVLVVDDEAPAREELAYLLGRDNRIRLVSNAASGAQALEMLTSQSFDVVFCDIKMPGLSGLRLARVLAQFAAPPQIVFVTACDDRAVEAFDLAATDYVMKPFRADRLAEAVRRVVTFGNPPLAGEADETIPVELAGVVRFVRRSQVRYVEAQGDYARLWTVSGSHLVRIPLAVLEQKWSGAGFARIHRSTLVAVDHIEEVRMIDGRTTVQLGDVELAVSRRHVRELRDRLESRGLR